MAKDLTLEEALEKIKELQQANEAQQSKITKLEKALAKATDENSGLAKALGALQKEKEAIEAQSLEHINELNTQLELIKLQKTGGLPVVKISEGEFAGTYRFKFARGAVKGIGEVKAIDVKSDSELLIALVSKKSGFIERVKEDN